MSDLIKAILDLKIDQVRELADTQSDLLSARSANGRLPFELALASGCVPICVALLRRRSPGSEGVRDYEALLEGYLSHLSHSHACAGWLSNIEFFVWCIGAGDKLPIEDDYGFGELGPETLTDLKFLSEKCQGWPHWIDGKVSIVALPRWQYLYKEWLERRRPRGPSNE